MKKAIIFAILTLIAMQTGVFAQDEAKKPLVGTSNWTDSAKVEAVADEAKDKLNAAANETEDVAKDAAKDVEKAADEVKDEVKKTY